MESGNRKENGKRLKGGRRMASGNRRENGSRVKGGSRIESDRKILSGSRIERRKYAVDGKMAEWKEAAE